MFKALISWHMSLILNIKIKSCHTVITCWNNFVSKRFEAIESFTNNFLMNSSNFFPASSFRWIEIIFALKIHFSCTDENLTIYFLFYRSFYKLYTCVHLDGKFWIGFLYGKSSYGDYSSENCRSINFKKTRLLMIKLSRMSIILRNLFHMSRMFPVGLAFSELLSTKFFSFKKF